MTRHFAAAAAAMLLAGPAAAAQVDLTGWTHEGQGTWTVQAGNDSVLQTQNGSPTVFFDGGNSQGTALSGEITVTTTNDDDFIGFVLGYHAGDMTDASANYLLIDWKQAYQNYNGNAYPGLAISHVSGALGDNSGAWAHDPSNNVTEIQRGATLGSTGWADNTTYEFDLQFTANRVRVYVNGGLELDITPGDAGLASFADGAFGFYNYSQPDVLYAGITEEVLPPESGVVPLPAALPMLLGGLAGLGVVARRRRG